MPSNTLRVAEPPAGYPLLGGSTATRCRVFEEGAGRNGILSPDETQPEHPISSIFLTVRHLPCRGFFVRPDGQPPGETDGLDAGVWLLGNRCLKVVWEGSVKEWGKGRCMISRP